MTEKVTVYTTESCPYCVRAKQLLKQRGVPYREVQFDWDDDAQWEALKKRSGMMSVPQIFFQSPDGTEKLIGGYQELAALDQKDQLKSLA